jgi:hypothetical protein
MNPLRDNPFNPPLATGVARFGFRKWYERELLSSHAHMVLAFLSLIGVFASLEASRGAQAWDRLVDVLFVVLCAAIGAWALRRYFTLLTRAELAANQARCEGCGEYGRFRVMPARLQGEQAQVCCTRCRHEWVIDIGDEAPE